MNDGVRLESISKTFGEGHRAVRAAREVSFSIAKGSLAVLSGPSGSGKTTLLNIIGGLEGPDAGRVIVGGRDITSLPEKALSRFRRAHVGFVFQQFNLLPELTVRENIELPMALNGIGGADRSKRVEDLLERLDLGNRIDAMPNELSGGEMQRVAVARAAAHRPEVILADEPTANLDSQNAREVILLLRSLRELEGVTIVISTHDEQVSSLADHRIVLHDGAVVHMEKDPLEE